MTTAPGPRARQARASNSPRYFSASIPAPAGKPFTARTIELFSGLTMIMVDEHGRGWSRDREHAIDADDVRVVFRSKLEYEDRVFAFIREVLVADDGHRVSLIFEPQGRSVGRNAGELEKMYEGLMAGIGVTDVADVTAVWSP